MHTSNLLIEQVTDEIAAREPVFHRPEFGTSLADFEVVLAA